MVRSGSITAYVNEVLQRARSAADDMSPQNPGDPAHPKVSRRSAIKTFSKTLQKYCAWSGAMRTFLNESDTSAFDIVFSCLDILLSGW